jgi:lipoprotein NlpI
MLRMNAGDRAGAAQQLQQALLLDPTHALSWNNRGLALLGLGHPFDCILHMERAIALDPDPSYLNNRGAAYAELGMNDKALADYDATVARKDIPEAHNNRGNLLNIMGRTGEARAAYARAIQLRPDYVDAQLNLAFCELGAGDFDAGWKRYEWRWRSSQLVPRGLPLPAWHGERTANRESGLLLYGEQGMGDALQFMRYAPLAREQWGGRVYIEVRPQLARLARSLNGIDGVVVFGEKLPDEITHQQALMSCPMILGTTLETIPNVVPYLYADGPRAAMWRKNLDDLPQNYGHNLLVGACWAGMSRDHQPTAAAIDAKRSMTFAQWAPLARVPGITWISLQKGPPAEQVQRPPSGMVVVDWTEQLDDWLDTAALVANLDMVVTVDTSVAHLAGAMGKPTLMLSRHAGCWRWMGHRPTTPWYPSMGLFHQAEGGDWTPALKGVERELQVMAQEQFMRGRPRVVA